MSQDIEKKVKRLYLAEKPFISANNETFRAKDIVYCLRRGMGEKPSPLGEDFSMLAV